MMENAPAMPPAPTAAPTPFEGRIGIVGAGALGAFYGARLARAGSDVHFLMRSDYDEVRRHGLQVNSIDGDFHLPNPDIYNSAEAVGPCDLVIIALKTTQNRHLPQLLAPLLHPKTLVLTLQNGLGNEEAIAAALKSQGGDPDESAKAAAATPAVDARIMGGIAFICSTRLSPGVIDHTAHGYIRLAQFRGAALDQTHGVAQAFIRAGIQVTVYDDLLRARWEKLVWNIPFNGLGVAARADTASILDSPDLTKVARALMDEALATAAADGAALPTDLPARMLKNTREMGAYRSSMQVDYEAGRPLEVDSIVSEPLRRAQRYGIATPHLHMLNALLKSLDPK